MKVSVRNHIIDLLAFKRLIPRRRRRFARALPSALEPHPVNRLVSYLHPPVQYLKISEVRDESPSTKTFRLQADARAAMPGLAPFRAGQYLSFTVDLEGVRITRPYSISSAPFEALGSDGFYEISVRKQQDGFLTEHMWAHWTPGIRVTASAPCGTFYHESLRDAGTIVGLAGGSGIAPFRSMAREIAYGYLNAEMVLLYGCSDEEDIPFRAELQLLTLRAYQKLRVVHVLSCEEISLEGCEQGLITADLIRKHADIDNSSFFICGPRAMLGFVMDELAEFDLPPKRVRRELYGEVHDPTELPDFPLEAADKVFGLTVHIGDVTTTVLAQASETLLVAMERAGLAPPSRCRSGECGVCRSLLVAGDIYVSADTDKRRAADKRHGYIHPCASYPLSDAEIVVPRSA
jgi:ferredoxin-NADP reductase